MLFSIVVQGSICGLHNISQIHQWTESDKVSEFLREEFGIEHTVLLLAFMSAKAGRTGITEHVKGNQATLEQEIRDYVQDESLRKTMDCKSITEKSRDRMERRTAYTTTDIDWLFGKEKWRNLCCIGAIKTELERKGTQTEEWHYYISSRCLTAQELLHHARMEWAVETMHWILGVHYSEDYCRIINRNHSAEFECAQKVCFEYREKV